MNPGALRGAGAGLAGAGPVEAPGAACLQGAQQTPSGGSMSLQAEPMAWPGWGPGLVTQPSSPPFP